MKPREPGSRRGRTLTLELDPALRAAVGAAAAARGQTIADWTRAVLQAAVGAPAAPSATTADLEALLRRLEAITGRLEATESRGRRGFR